MQEEYVAKHYVHRSNWIRAAVLGANDGLLSTASLVVGVAAAHSDKEAVVLAAVAGLVAGALSMAAGEYVSVSSQADIEKADIAREQQELIDMPEIELQRLADIYVERGVDPDTALEVARQLSAKDALRAHLHDELGINDLNQANPLLAAVASGVAFTLGALLPLIIALFAPLESMVWYQYAFCILFLMLLGAVSAILGGVTIWRPIMRATFWGTAAMAIAAWVGHWLGVQAI